MLMSFNLIINSNIPENEINDTSRRTWTYLLTYLHKTGESARSSPGFT
jgi:hypothetical protein